MGSPWQPDDPNQHGECEHEIARLEALVFVPGVWRCAKCDFRLIQSNLNARDGTVTARDTPGDKCPNCASPLWRVTERQERTEALDLVEKHFERTADLLPQLKIAKGHIEHMAAWIGRQQAGYSFEGIGEDMPGIEAAIIKATA